MAVMPEHLIAKIKADALREAADEFYDADRLSTTTWLRERAEKLVNPKPAVDLPTEDHHFGWLTAPGTLLAKGRVAGEWFFGEVAIRCSGIDGINRQKVIEWIPGTLVPTSALDELREYIGRISPTSVLTTGDLEAVRRFLAAVDEAHR